MNTDLERIESLKAGIIGSGAAGATFAITTLVHQLLSFQAESLPTVLIASFIHFQTAISGAIALVSGFLFGVTYRYIVRADQNSHLKSGAVLAFGLVRGFAAIENLIVRQGEWGWLAVRVTESILLFAIAQMALDWAIRQTWIRPFQESR
ncbi:MAG: hypothetical protein ACFE0I_09830 [Elainellaceae cyanobacterium]